MKRIPLLGQREGLTETQTAVFDAIVKSRGQMLRPFEVLLHVPEMASVAGELGHQLRFEGSLTDHDRELAIITVATAHRCDFEWQTHVGLARDAGVAEATISALATGGKSDEIDPADTAITDFVQELCASSTAADNTFARVQQRLGDAGVVELSTLVGYYTLLAYVMNVAGTS